MAEEAQRLAWDKAQSFGISLDLVAAAKEELSFLALVDANPWLCEGQALKQAIHRYTNYWLPFAIDYAKDEHAKFPPVPPLDCAWIWHCHKLNPVQYAEDCKEMLGNILDAPLIPPKHRDAAALESKAQWEAKFPDEPYSLDLSRSSPPCPEHTKITYNLEDAVSRQKTFYNQVSQPHYLDESFLKAAEQRYKAFLYITTLGSNFFVPTYDVDVIWHAHQRSPVAYARDLLHILGKVLSHDDTDSDRSEGKKLDIGFQKTRAIWHKTFGFPYEKPGCMHRGIFLDASATFPVAAAGCGSGCGGGCGSGCGGCGSLIAQNAAAGCGSGCGAGGCGGCGSFGRN